MQISAQMIAVHDIPASLPKRGGRPIHLSTIYRWIRRGVRGKRLEVAQIGGQIFTTHEALNRFFSPNSEPASQPKSDVGSTSAIERAEAELAAFGHCVAGREVDHQQVTASRDLGRSEFLLKCEVFKRRIVTPQQPSGFRTLDSSAKMTVWTWRLPFASSGRFDLGL